MRAKRRRALPVRVHERLTKELPYGSEIASTVEEDPYEAGGRIRMLRSIRDDPLAGLWSREQIDQTQFAAGRRWQRHFERAGVGMVVALDPTKEHVDGHGPGRADITDQQMAAFAELNRANAALGWHGATLVHMVLGQGLAIREICRRRNEETEIKIKYWGHRLRECLETLAEVWGFVSNGRNK